MLAKLISRKGRYHRTQKLPWLKRMISFFFLKGFGNGGENVQKSSAAKFRDLDGGKKSRKNEICEGKNLGNL